MAETPLVDKWQKTFIKNDDGTYTLRCSLKVTDLEIGSIEIKDALSDLRATLEDRGGKGAITVQIVDASGNQITSFGASVIGIKNILGDQIDPATDNTLQDILTELEKKTEPSDIQKVQEQNPLNISDLAKESKQLPDNHNVTVSNQIEQPTTPLDTQPISTDELPLPTGASTSDNQQPPVTTPTVYNVTLTNANTEYSQALPANTREFRFHCRTLYDCRFAWVTGKVATPTSPYLTLFAGSDYYSDNDNLASQTLYLASSTAGVVIEIECWT